MQDQVGQRIDNGLAPLQKPLTIQVKIYKKHQLENAHFRKLEWNYMHLEFQHLRDILEKTKCKKPCKYKKYRMVWDRQPMPVTRTPTDGFGLRAISNYTTVGEIICVNQLVSESH